MSIHPSPTPPIDQLDIPLERDVFLRQLVRELSGMLESVVGLTQASGFISVVGQRVGEWIDGEYRRALGTDKLSRDQVVDVLIDLKRRIQGDFYVVEVSEERIVLGNRLCPFADKVKDRPSMCMMTSNVFGTIAAQNLGRAKVVLDKTIAEGDPGCRVVIYLTPSAEAEAAEGREYFAS
ncbi:MAG: methanogen output domain 1-containing protein [Hydrogenophaga sp.]|jgi:predicted ArsR family transcriptional regulator|nr:methanogen output domain 1-containing protein [Hydrogenophaga sp.]